MSKQHAGVASGSRRRTGRDVFPSNNFPTHPPIHPAGYTEERCIQRKATNQTLQTATTFPQAPINDKYFQYFCTYSVIKIIRKKEDHLFVFIFMMQHNTHKLVFSTFHTFLKPGNSQWQPEEKIPAGVASLSFDRSSSCVRKGEFGMFDL